MNSPVQYKRAIAAASLVALLVFIVYLPSLSNGFANWDDPAYVYRNAHIRAFDPVWAFTSVIVGTWLPLTLLSFTMDYAVWGPDPFGYHLTNNILHAMNTALVLLLTVSLCARAARKDGAGPLWAGMAAALLFGLHPLRVESVVWVAERKDVLCAFFFLLSVLAYLRYASGGKRALYAASLAAAALALLSKPMAVTLPAVLLLLDLYPLNRFKTELKKALLEKLPFFTLSAAASAAAIWAQGRGGALSPISMSLHEKGAAAIRAAVFYLYKTIVPVNLAPFYPHPGKTGVLTAETIISLLVLAAIAALCVVTFKRRRYFTAALLCYIITLAPVSGIIQVGSQAAADRYTYLPTISLFIIAGAAFAHAAKGRFKVPVALAGVLIAAALSWATVSQGAIWKDSLTLWSYEIERYPGRVALAYANRGIALGSAGMDEAAIADFTGAIAIDPNMRMAWYNRALSMSNLRRYREAVADLDVAIAIDPLYADAYHVAHANLAEYEKAIADFKAYISIDPSGAAYMNLAMAQRMAGRDNDAQESFRAAYRLGVQGAGQYLRERSGD